MVKKLFLVIGICFFIRQPLCFSGEDDLSYLAKDNKPVRAFLGDFINESGKNQIAPIAFKESLKISLLRRKAVTFKIVNTPSESDVQISAVIKKYLYSKTDPVTTFASPGGFLLDAATTENYVEMSALFTITDTKTGKVIWRDTVSTFIKHMMTPEDSIPMIYEKLSRVFLWKSFGKPNR